jgi:hypothetical protein
MHLMYVSTKLMNYQVNHLIHLRFYAIVSRDVWLSLCIRSNPSDNEDQTLIDPRWILLGRCHDGSLVIHSSSLGHGVDLTIVIVKVDTVVAVVTTEM